MISQECLTHAFDAIASEYDRRFTDTSIGRAQRNAVWNIAREVFLTGSRLLELNCGTGVDALFLAGLGMQIVALDQSSRMIEVAKERAGKSQLASQLRFVTWDIEQLDRFEDRAGFQGVFSNFGGLNCVPDLSKLSKDLASLIRPGGRALICILSKYCLWEVVYFACQFQFRKAFRRWPSSGSLWNTQTSTIRVWYPSVQEMKRFMLPHFRYLNHCAVGLTVPPSYLEGWMQRHEKLLTAACRFDRIASGVPGLRNLGDHCCMLFERVPDDPELRSASLCRTK